MVICDKKDVKNMDKLCNRCNVTSEGINERHKFCLNCGNQLYFTLQDHEKAQQKKRETASYVAITAIFLGCFIITAVFSNIIPAIVGVLIIGYIYNANH